jgi:hypothetical protein
MCIMLVIIQKLSLCLPLLLLKYNLNFRTSILLNRYAMKMKNMQLECSYQT